MIARLFRLLGIDLDTIDVVIVPVEQWHRVFERVRVAEARVQQLERQLAAMEQGAADAAYRDARTGRLIHDDDKTTLL